MSSFARRLAEAPKVQSKWKQRHPHRAAMPVAVICAVAATIGVAAGITTRGESSAVNVVVTAYAAAAEAPQVTSSRSPEIPGASTQLPATGPAPLDGLRDTAEAEALMAGFDVSFAVLTQDGAFAGLDADDLVVSASAAKLYWVAAALSSAGIEAVEPYAEAIFAWSDNDAAAEVIDLVGADGINMFLRDIAGLEDTALMQWGEGRTASGYPGPLHGENYTTAVDAVTFLSKLAKDELLGPAETAALLNWMALTPRDSSDGGEYAGMLGELLPEAARDLLKHKAGWLPPSEMDGETGTLIDIGVVTLPSGSWYAIAILGTAGASFESLPGYVSWLSCSVYAGLSGEATSCAG